MSDFAGRLGRVARRHLLKAATSAFILTAGGGILVACARTKAEPVNASSGKIRLLLQVSWQGGVPFGNNTPQQITDAFIEKNWTSKHPGVEVRTQAGSGSNGPSSGIDPTIAAILAGDGPDIVVACCAAVPTLFASGILEPLDPLLKADNIDLQKLYPPMVLEGLSQGGQLLGLPDYFGGGPMFVNLTLLDQVGLRYPSPEWTAAQAADLWRSLSATTGGGKTQRSGAILPDHASLTWLVRGWGGHVRDVSGTRCLLDSPQSIAAHEWLVELMRANVLLNCQGCVTPLLSGQVAFDTACCGKLEKAVLVLGNKIKWDLQPLPTFPAGPSTFDGFGMYGLNALSRNPRALVWDLFKFVTVTPGWHRLFNAQLALMPPPLLSPALWDDWQQIVERVVPPLKEKHLDYYRQAAQSASGWSWFKYDAVSVGALWLKYVGLMATQGMSVTGGLHALTDQVNAMEASAAREAIHQPSISLRTLRADVQREQLGLTAMFHDASVAGLK